MIIGFEISNPGEWFKSLESLLSKDSSLCDFQRKPWILQEHKKQDRFKREVDGRGEKGEESLAKRKKKQRKSLKVIRTIV